MTLSRVVRSIKPSPTLEITAKVSEKKAAGADVLGFGAGEPDFNTPENIKKAAQKAMDDGFTKYTTTTGIHELKEAVVDLFRKQPGIEYTANQIIISTGAKQVLANAIMALCDPDDEVIIPSPYWVSYPEMVRLAGAQPQIIPMTPDAFQLDVEAIEKRINTKTKAIIINSPCNPTGSAFNKESLESLAELAVRKDIFVISDEVYDFLLYEGKEHVSIMTLRPEMKERGLLVNAVSKKYAMTGWRIGYGAGPKDLIAAMGRIQGHYTSNPNSIAQKAALEALTGDQRPVEKMVQAFAQRRDYIYRRISSMPGLKTKKPQGTFYLWVNIENILGKKADGREIRDDFSFCEAVLATENLAFVPGGAFGTPNYLRISFATSMEDIQKGMERLERFLQKLND